jgi:hypothetical protein
MGADKQINPLSLIISSDPSNNKKNQAKHEFEGTFANDYLLAGDGTEKGKRIIKAGKRIHYKTKMCPYGRDCRKRLTCTYAHTEN